MNEERIRQTIQKYVKQQCGFIIMPMGKWGKITKKILNQEFGIQERFCIDNGLEGMERIFSVKDMPKPGQNDVFLNVVWDQYTEFFLRQEVSEKYPNAKIVDVLREQEIEELFSREDKVHLDFLAVGFPRCGTTSLDAALRKNNKIYLPPFKETHFFWNMNQETHKIFKKYYPENTEQLVGAIEPTYRIMPDYVYRYFGKDLKVLFCVRNPVNALYSFYKMAMCVFGGSNIQHIKKYENISAQTFDIWAKENKKSYRYSEYIKNYMQYYPREQIKILVSEELFEKTETQMNQLQEFIGLKESERIKYSKFPHENKRAVVSKNYSMALINKELTQYARELKYSDPAFLGIFSTIKTRLEKITMKNYKEAMLPSTYNYLMEYYMESIYELEEMMGRSLKGIWY